MSLNVNYISVLHDNNENEIIGARIEIPEISYKRSEISESERVGKIIESFGYLGSDAPHRVKIPVTSDFSFVVGNINVIYGPSGSGKTSIINKIKEKYGGHFINDLPVEKDDDFLINLVGKDVTDAVKILTAAGLGEGNLFLRKCAQLSEGQKFRMRLALELSKDSSEILYVDEFGSKLDQITSKALAKSFSKNVRRNNRCIFICCNSLDVALAFDFDTLIKLGYDYKVETCYKSENCNHTNLTIDLVKGSLDDYYEFKRYHYLDTDGRVDNSKIIIAKLNNEKIGITILAPPLSKRREILHPYFQLINRKLITGHRTVVHPEFRGAGVGRMLAVDGPKLLGYEIIERRSTLYSFIPIPLQWGYNEYVNTYFENRPYYDELEKFIRECGFNPSKLIFKGYCEEIIGNMDCKKLAVLLKRDEDEKHKAQLRYYCDIMEICGYGYEGNIDELLNLLVSIDKEPETKEELVETLVKHRQSFYRSFYFDLRE